MVQKQVLLRTKTIAGIKIVEIIPTLTNIRSIVKDGKLSYSTVHKQIFHIALMDWNITLQRT